jgi:hypothetical protein
MTPHSRCCFCHRSKHRPHCYSGFECRHYHCCYRCLPRTFAFSTWPLGQRLGSHSSDLSTLSSQGKLASHRCGHNCCWHFVDPAS